MIGHIEEAECLVEEAGQYGDGPHPADRRIALAQVHATLALVEAINGLNEGLGVDLKNITYAIRER